MKDFLSIWKKTHFIRAFFAYKNYNCDQCFTIHTLPYNNRQNSAFWFPNVP